MNKRIAWIDVAKGICIISVILGHCENPIVNKIVFPFHLTVFFILSGYTLKKQEMDSTYFIKKFNTLIKPYFITCLLVIMFDIFNIIIINRLFSFDLFKLIIKNNLLRTFFASGTIAKFGPFNMGGIIGAIWFLPALFFAIVLSQFIINKLDKWIYRFFITISLAIVSIIIAKFIWLPFSILSSLFALPFILFGFFIREFNLLDNIKNYYYILFLAIYIFGIIANKSMILFVTCNVPDMLFTPIVAISSSLVILKISTLLNNFKFLAWIGKNSLNILCIHLLELKGLSLYINKLIFFLSFPINFFTKFLIYIIVCLLIVQIKTLIEKRLSAKQL